MNPVAIIERAAVDGVVLTLSPAGTIKVRGEQSSVSRWLPKLRKHKADILGVLSGNAAAQPAPVFQSDAIVAAERTWKPGNPYTCACGHATGWRTDGHPLCPACVSLENPGEYWTNMLACADELEREAFISEPERRGALLAVVRALRQDYESFRGNV